jgi:hypothetical protein
MIRITLFHPRGQAVIVAALLACAVLTAGAARADTGQNLPERNRLLDLARQMVTTVGTRLDSISAEQARKNDPLGSVPDGEPLLFRVLMNGKVAIEGDILAIKEGNTLMASFRDFLSTLYFPIQYDGTTQVAEGWYIRENKVFRLDVASRTVEADGRRFTLSSAVREDGDDLLIPLTELESWFGLTLTPSISNMALDLRSKETLPLESRLKRQDRTLGRNDRYEEAKLPRIDDPYKMIEMPKVDVTSSISHVRPGEENANAEPVTSYGSTVQAEGDFLMHTGKVFMTGSKENRLSSVRVNLSKDSENSDLLGPLKARHYEIGDVVVTDIPLFTGGAQELGARVTNREPTGLTSFTTRTFSGDLPPGWDIELYQNEQLVDFITVDDTGFYSFEDVLLFAGENDFRLVFYGPQGELREESVSIPVDLAEFQKEGYYDVSISSQNKSTYINEESDLPENGDISVTATYEKPITTGLSGIVGVRQRTFDTERKTQFLTGLSTNLGGALFNTNLGFDEKGEAGLDSNIRKRFGRHDTSLGVYTATNAFSPEGNSEIPTVFNTTFNARGPLFEIDRQNVDYGFRAQYAEDAEGDTLVDIQQNLNALIKPVRINHSLNYRQQTAGDFENLESGLTLSGILPANIRWRARAVYEYLPESRLESSFLELNKNLFSGVSGTAQIEHQFDPQYTKGTLRANWQTDDWIITPQVSLDSDNEFRATLASRYGLIPDPRSGKIDATKLRQGGTGSASVFVYLDKNGDNIFNEGDEPIEGARVDSLQTRRYGETNETGLALIQGLQEQQPTDVKISLATLDDPYWIPGTEGVSFVPRPGHTAQIDLPVHNSGEMDGTIWIEKNGARRPARNIKLVLFDQDGREAATTRTAYDGFYIFNTVKPGRYYIAFDARDIKGLGVSSPPPQEVSFGYEGTIIYGRDYILRGNTGEGSAAFTVVSGLNDIQARHPHVALPALAENTPMLNLGSYKSQLSMSLMLYRIKTKYPGLLSGDHVLIKPSDALPDMKTGEYTLRVYIPGSDMNDAYRRCKSLSARGVGCTVELLPKGFTPQPT